jgi:hypothetical protein
VRRRKRIGQAPGASLQLPVARETWRIDAMKASLFAQVFEIAFQA